jgi:hypothetical protein
VPRGFRHRHRRGARELASPRSATPRRARRSGGCTSCSSAGRLSRARSPRSSARSSPRGG